MVVMFDMPNTEASPSTVIVAKSQTERLNKSFTIGTCEIVPADRDPYTGEILSLYPDTVGNPVMNVDKFIWDYVYKAGLKSEAEQSRIRSIMDSMREKATATLIKQAQHVKYELDEYISTAGFNYESKEGYQGKDSFSYLVKYGPYIVKVNSYVHVGVADPWGDGDNPESDRRNLEKICGKRGTMWRVVSLNADNSGSISTSEYALSSANFAGYNYLPPKITFANLSGAAVGETTGEGANASITLDTDAAGHGWYVGGLRTEDGGQATLSPTLSQRERGLSGLTPWYEQGLFDMSNWLPTSNPNEWIARAGTAAEGKMDMLSVLLHEYGHALGIEHSADAHDYMGTTLTPGMRRLPGTDEIQLMAQLAAEAREAIVAGQGYTLLVDNDQDTPSPTLPIDMGFGISFLGLLRRNNGSAALNGQNDTGFQIKSGVTPIAQYDIAANTTLTNGTFVGSTTSAWETTGKVTTQANNATLNEVASSQTRVNQVFVVGADDRYLSFTLSNIGLEGTSALTQTSSLSPTPLPQGEGLPGDAFEVALLNANSGGSLAANIGLSRTDALLNYLLLLSMSS